MSILLTAGKKAVAKKKPKSAQRRKRSSQQPPNFNPTPPISSSRTAVWHWILDTIPTTVMLSKESNEVWCNGVVLDTIDGFVDDDSDTGGVVDFCIVIEETQSTHKARIKRGQSSDPRYGILHELFVDGYQIQEHIGDGTPYQEQFTEQYQQYQEQYEEAYPDQGGLYAYPSNYHDGYEQPCQENGYDQEYDGYGYQAVAGASLPAYEYGEPDAPPCYEEATSDKKNV